MEIDTSFSLSQPPSRPSSLISSDYIVVVDFDSTRGEQNRVHHRLDLDVEEGVEREMRRDLGLDGIERCEGN